MDLEIGKLMLTMCLATHSHSASWSEIGATTTTQSGLEIASIVLPENILIGCLLRCFHFLFFNDFTKMKLIGIT